jgi:hypothetical protein
MIVSKLQQCLAALRPTDWQSDPTALAPLELLAFPLEAFLQHGKASLNQDLVGVTAQASALDHAVMEAETRLLGLRQAIMAQRETLLERISQALP